MPKVSIPQKNLKFHVENNSNLMNALIAIGLPVASSCHGDGICTMCKVKVTGRHNAPESFEIEALKRNKCSPDERLSCQILVNGDLVVTTTYW